MANFLSQIKALDASTTPAVYIVVESRRVRRQRQRDAAQIQNAQTQIKKAG